MSREAMKQALEALESDPISHAGPVTVLSPGKGTGCGYTNINENWTPIYTAPPKREWVGLTADEIWKCNKAKSGSAVEFHICYEHQNVEDFAASIEAKLKEKNT